ncbi:MAG: hypothetical protein Q9185_005024 [Variospora sp. 1 TL-2023]
MWSRPGILAGLVIGLLTVAKADQRPQDAETGADVPEFSELLNQVDPESLHAALHDYSPKKFKHGMFKEDRTAAEAIHREQPSLASTIVAIAKRQDTSSNGTAPTPTENSPTPPDNSPTTPPVESPEDVEQSPTTPPVAVPSPVDPVEGSSLENPDTPTTPTTTVDDSPNEPPETITSTSTSPDVPTNPSDSPTTTEGEDSTPSSPDATPSAPDSVPSLTDGQVITTTNPDGFTILSTIGGGYVTLSRSSSGGSPSAATTATTRNTRRTSSTSVVLATTTLPDGSQSTVTAVTVVPANSEEGATPTGEAGAGGTGTPGSSPVLQSGVATKKSGQEWEFVCLLGAAVGVAMMM